MEEKYNQSKIINTMEVFNKNGFRKIIPILYQALSISILLSVLFWIILILYQVIDKGRLPVESDPRFIKGLRLKIGFISLLLMTYGSLIWFVFTGLIYWSKKITISKISIWIGLVSVILSAIMIYFIFFSQSGQWILD